MAYNRDENFMYFQKNAKKSNRMSEESQGITDVMLCSFDMLFIRFTNTKWPNCVFMDTIWMFIDLGLSVLGRGLIVYFLCETQDSVQPFLVEPLLHVGLRPGVKGSRSRLYRVKRNE